MISILTIENFLAVVSLLGMALTSRHESRLFGFAICGIGNILWLYWILIGNTGSVLLFGGYLVFNAIGTHDELVSYLKIRSYNERKKEV